MWGFSVAKIGTKQGSLCVVVAKTKHWTHHGEHAHTSFSGSGRQLRLMRPVSCMITSVNIAAVYIKSEINPVFTDWAYIYRNSSLTSQTSEYAFSYFMKAKRCWGRGLAIGLHHFTWTLVSVSTGSNIAIRSNRSYTVFWSNQSHVDLFDPYVNQVANVCTITHLLLDLRRYTKWS